MSDLILVEQADGIATVTINRPKMRNALSLAMWTAMGEVTQRLAADDSVRAIVYRGAGAQAFASGADISEFPASRKDTETASRYNATTAAAYAAVRECPKPTIAMIYGYCMGGAVGLAMACDLRFAAKGSKFGIPAARLSIIYPAEAIAQLVDLVGPAYAKDILFSARVLDGREALSIGLIQRLVPAADLQTTTDDYLKLLADNAPLSLRGSKLTIQSYLAGYTDESRARLRAAVREATESADYREGTQAFLEKRRPKFHGR
jgi:enoyl-CoA hydratase